MSKTPPNLLVSEERRESDLDTAYTPTSVPTSVKAPAQAPASGPLRRIAPFVNTKPSTSQQLKQITGIDRLLFKEVDNLMTEGYTYPETNNSTICDIVAMYLKGQKILYTEAKTVCEVRLHYLMLPAILITAAASILSLILKDTANGPMIVSILNSVNTFLLTLINYLKLDARAEAHRTAAYKFDKLQSYMEFSSGRILFDTEASLKLAEILEKVEHDVREIKETNQFVLPEKIRYEFPKLNSINVFAEVKKIVNQESLHIDLMKDYMNKIIELEEPFMNEKKPVDDVTRKIIDGLEEKRKEQVKQVLLLKNVYLAIDQKFEVELEAHRERRKYRCHFCGWLKS